MFKYIQSYLDYNVVEIDHSLLIKYIRSFGRNQTPRSPAYIF